METTGYFDDIKKLFRKTDQQMKETDRQMKETDRRLRELGKQIGGLGNRLGEFVEGLIRPSLVDIFAARGIAVHQTYRDVEAERDGVAAQIDLLVVNDNDVIAVEVKSKLIDMHVNEHIERLGKFRHLFPKYQDARLLGAVAAMVISKEAAQYAIKRGLFVIGQKGESAVLLNDKSFEPIVF